MDETTLREFMRLSDRIGVWLLELLLHRTKTIEDIDVDDAATVVSEIAWEFPAFEDAVDEFQPLIVVAHSSGPGFYELNYRGHVTFIEPTAHKVVSLLLLNFVWALGPLADGDDRDEIRNNLAGNPYELLKALAELDEIGESELRRIHSQAQRELWLLSRFARTEGLLSFCDEMNVTKKHAPGDIEFFKRMDAIPSGGRETVDGKKYRWADELRNTAESNLPNGTDADRRREVACLRKRWNRYRQEKDGLV